MADKSKKAYYVAMYGIMAATIFVAMFIDKALSAFLPISMAVVVLIATFSFCLIQNDWLMGFVSGAIFGLASWMKALIFGEPLAIYGFIYVVPRLFVGISCFAVYRLVLWIVKRAQSEERFLAADNKQKWWRQSSAMMAGIFVGLVVNTVLFLTATNICKELLGQEYTGLLAIIRVVLFTNILPEYLISILAVPQIALGVRRGLRLGIEAQRSREKSVAQGTLIATESADAKDLKPDKMNG